jgi:RNA polymerase sigma factor (sigma-70 family)
VTVAVAHRKDAIPDGVLVQEAAAGSGTSYGALYDRYAQQVYNYSLRLTGSPDDAADATHEAFLNVLRRLQDDDRPVLEFAPYLFAAARNESYALMRRRSRVHPSETVPEQPDETGVGLGADPERVALLHDAQAEVRAANAQLAPRHREVLALRELGDHSYEEIGRIMGISENGAAQLIWRARSKLREALTAGAVASVVATSTDCERAQVLLSRIQDGEFVDELDRDWLDMHLDECGSCRAARGMLLEVGATYSAWLPAALLVGMRPETLTAAGGVIGADWSSVGTAAPAGGGSGAGVAVAGVATLAAIGIALSVVIDKDPELERNVTEPREQPAVTMEEPAKSKRKAPAATPSDANLAARQGAELAGLRGQSSPRGEQPAGGPRGEVRGREREPGPRGRGPGEPNPPPGAQTPGPAPPGPPETRPQPPVDTTPPPRPRPEPPIDTKPPPEPPRPEPTGSCTHPGGGPPGCPPGHGGAPPGHGGFPPGLGSAPPGHGGTPPGQAKKP